MRAMPPVAPRVIYVKDFDLEPGSFQAESGILPISPISAGAFIPRLLGVPQDSTVRERELVKLMSSALVDDLASAGLNARPLPPGEPFPSAGWLVRGAFVQVDEGNRLRRALIGFGNGATRLRVIVWVSDLAHGSLGPFCALDTSCPSSKLNPHEFMVVSDVWRYPTLVATPTRGAVTAITRRFAEFISAPQCRGIPREPSLGPHRRCCYPICDNRLTLLV